MPKIIYRLFLFLLIFSPLAFGTVELWSLTIMELSAIATVLIFFIHLNKHKKPLYEIPGAVPFILILLYTLLQLTPFPIGLIKLISPSAYSLYNNTLGPVEHLGWMSVSINSKATLAEFFRLAAYFCFYVLTIQILSQKKELKKTVSVVIIFATLLAVLAMAQYLIPIQMDSKLHHKIFWLRGLTHSSIPFGPYVNHNHYAGLMEMLFPIILSLFLFYKPVFAHGPTLRAKLADAVIQIRTNKHLLLGMASVLTALSIFLSMSRSGMISFGVALIVLFALINIKKPGKFLFSSGLILCICLLLILFVSWFGWDAIVTKFALISGPQGDLSSMRLIFWKDCLDIIKEFPLTGTGMGTLVSIYPSYRTFPGNALLTHAHNDYIELLTDGGIVAATLFIWFMGAVFYQSWRIIGKRHESYSIYLFIGSFSGMIAMLAHSVTDFNLHIGANGLYFSFLAGLSVSAANTRIRKRHELTYLKQLNFSNPKFFIIPLAVLFIACFVFNCGALISKLYYTNLKDVHLNRTVPDKTLQKVAHILKRASRFDPMEAKYHFDMARTKTFLAEDTAALTHFKQTLRLDPANGTYLETLADYMSHHKKFEVADRLFRVGMQCDINNPHRRIRYATWLFSQAKKSEGVASIRKALSLDPQLTDDALTLMVINKLTDKEMRKALPQRVTPHLVFAEYLQKTGSANIAEGIYLTALEYMDNENDVKADYFYKVYQFYMLQKRYQDALAILQKAIAALPEDVGLRLNIAVLYEKIGIKYRAQEEYQNALILDPENQNAQKQLDRIRGNG
ncbi:O-antigen ligase family protein [Desulfococcaceae bacterium HSG7]|nr:O-antigen ligase family protein [Desulfococcaceae bacterium HSG7]